MVNFDLVIGRIESFKGISGDKYVAAALGISPQDFSNRKKRGSLLPVIIEWAINENVNLDWLINGEPIPIVSEAAGDYSYKSELEEMLLRVIKEGDEAKMAAVKAVLELADPGRKAG